MRRDEWRNGEADGKKGRKKEDGVSSEAVSPQSHSKVQSSFVLWLDGREERKL